MSTEFIRIKNKIDNDFNRINKSIATKADQMPPMDGPLYAYKEFPTQNVTYNFVSFSGAGLSGGLSFDLVVGGTYELVFNIDLVTIAPDTSSKVSVRLLDTSSGYDVIAQNTYPRSITFPELTNQNYPESVTTIHVFTATSPTFVVDYDIGEPGFGNKSTNVISWNASMRRV